MGTFDTFNSIVYNKFASLDLYNLFINLFKFPLGTQTFFVTILYFFPLNNLLTLFTIQTAWFTHKFVIWGFYILTWISILIFTKHTKTKKAKVSLLESSLYYFLSFSILLLSIALSNPEILAAPFFILSVTFLFKKKFKLTLIFYLLSILFSWNVLIFAPVYSWYIYTESNKKSLATKFLIFLPVLMFVSFFAVYFWGLIEFGPTRVIFDLLPTSISFGLIKFVTLFIKSNTVIFLLNLSFFVFYFLALCKIIKLNLEKNLKFLIGLLCLLFIFVVFFPVTTEGSLIWLTILSLLVWIQSPSKFNSTNLLLINILVFVNVYLFFGPSGTVPLRGRFVETFRYILSFLSIMFAFWFLKLKLFLSSEHLAISWLQKFIVFFLFLTFLAHFPAEGCPEAADYASFIAGTFKYGNPLISQIKVLNYHPPLNILILSFFTLVWNTLNGIGNGYYMGIKLAIFFFYLLTIVSYLKFGQGSDTNNKLSVVEKLLTIFTTFILIIGSLNQSDINIFLFPFIIGSIYALFKNKYFWSGFLIGLSFSIKWQSILLLPLFAVSIINFKKSFKEIFNNSFRFLWGFVPIVAFFWALLLIQPGGAETIKIIIDGFYRVRGNYLSGNSLNLGWIAGYFILPKNLELGRSLASAGMINFSIGANSVPYIFRGVLFSIASIIILFRYWLFQKKNIVTFLSTAVMLYFSHQMLGRGTQELHFIYIIILMLFLYLVKPTVNNRLLLILFDVMAIVNVIFFYCFTGYPCLNKRFIGGFDITVILAIYYIIIFLWIFWRYLKDKAPFS